MKQILVGKAGLAYAAKSGGGTISGINELNLLDTGALAVFTKNGVMVTTANAATVLDDVKEIYIAVGNQVDACKSFLSSLIPRSRATYDIKSYVAPVKQVKYLGYDGTTAGTSLNLPTLVAGDEAFIKIINTTPGLRTIGAVDEQEVFRYSEQVRSGDTATTILTRLVAQMNATLNQTPIVTAAIVSTNQGLSFTANDFGTTFKIARDGIFINSTIVEAEGSTTGVAVAVNYGHGTSTQILALEDAYSVEHGNTNRVQTPALYYRNTSLVTSGARYDTYTIGFNGERTISTGRQDTSRFEILVAIPNAATQQSAFETIMTEVFAGLVANSPAEKGS